MTSSYMWVQGFFGASTPDLDQWANPSWGVWTGVDQVRLHQVYNIDYASHHLWPDEWFERYACGANCKVNFMKDWLDAQYNGGNYHFGKPVLLGEYKCASVISQDGKAHLSGMTECRMLTAQQIGL